MTVRCRADYSQPAMNELQHAGAFVVQFRAGTDFGLGRVGGRVEHIASGRSGQFESAGALLDLIAGMLADAQSPEPSSSVS
jgi:hypothetical protein